MNNAIELPENTIIKLQELIIEIDEVEKEYDDGDRDDCDIVIENLYKIKDLISTYVLQ